LKEYKTREERKSKFVCVLTAILPEGEIIVARGECNGSIALKYEKLGGLTYSPVFIPDGFDKPMGDMDDPVDSRYSGHAPDRIRDRFRQIREARIRPHLPEQTGRRIALPRPVPSGPRRSPRHRRVGMCYRLDLRGRVPVHQRQQ
ncbi:MAG: hypothetical protein IKA98_03115, partial [Candidatus Methanomethylophilaceae archaeon]|nr:hypothetical protein [Candidatus Methanomethylophilaceae archaeon]